MPDGVGKSSTWPPAADRAEFCRDIASGSFALVFVSRPEESPQSVTFPAWYYVDMEMGNALADSIVYRHERSLRAKPFFHGARQALCIQEQGSYHVRRQFSKSGHMLLGDQKRVAGKERAVVEKGKRRTVLEYNVALNLTAHYLAEWAVQSRQAHH